MSKCPERFHVFFVDDDVEICSLLTEKLKSIDCCVTVFNSAEACLERLAADQCDLIITDMKMPGMSGLAFLKKMQRIAPWIPIIILTAYGDVPIAVESIKEGAAGFLEKPIDGVRFSA